MLILATIMHCSPYKKYADKAEPWEEDILALEQLDKTEKYSSNGILFIGSSSIRKWDNIKEDLAPYEPIRRGYGGAKYTDLIHFTERLVSSHKLQAVAIFVANDITGGENDLHPNEVLKLAKLVIKDIRKIHPNIPIFQIAITPVGSRWEAWTKTNDFNNQLKSYTDSTPNLYFIETADSYLTSEGIPNDALFISDRLHQNQKGYDIWAKLIKMEFDKVLK